MRIESIEALLAWSVVVNYAVLIVWFLALRVARGAIYRLHARWFALDDRTFDAVHYAGMAFYKVLVLVFNVAPLAAVAILRARGG